MFTTSMLVHSHGSYRGREDSAIGEVKVRLGLWKAPKTCHLWDKTLQTWQEESLTGDKGHMGLSEDAFSACM